MKCTVSQEAADKLNEILNAEEDKNLKLRVFVAHAHDDHAHYGLGLDYEKDTDVVVKTETGVEILLEEGEDFLDGIEVDYFPDSDEWSIGNPAKGGHGHHH
jgi:iron-sulfur cluster insertion protein